MKRKRGNKKGKPKRPSVVGAKEAGPNVVSLNTEDNSGADDFDNDEFNSGMEVETPSSTGTDQPEKLANVNSDGLPEKAAVKSVYGRVKVKIKTSKALDSQLTSSDAPTRSDTDKSTQQVGIEKPGVINEKVEDSANSLPEMNMAVSGNPSKKSGSIKIKSSRGIGSSSISQSRNDVLVQGERPNQKEPKLLHRGPRYNEQELNDSLEVIKKVMKMDAAEPFNAPVNPIALGIPDYFDVIDTPMDFGTICSNLENGVKYMNSEDVFKDVQYIWNNCYKYNNKGDYVLELMKRVKKNFMKYWTAAGLYSKQPQSINGTERSESIQAKDAALSSHGKMQVKGAHSKHKSRKRHGVKKHKDDCLCAICIMMRRRQEREKSAQPVEHLNETSNSPLSQEVKPKETSPIESPCGEDSSSNMENSLGPDAETDSEEKGEEVKLKGTDQLHSTLQEKQELEEDNSMEIQIKDEGEISEHSRLDDRSEDEHIGQYQIPAVESGGDVHSDTQKEETSMQHTDETAAAEQQEPKELPEKREERTKMYENLQRFENPMLLDLCGRLFPGTRKSVWVGPHSLVQRQGYVGNRSIHEAIATLMK